MADYITLLGAEEVASAGRSISSAADRMVSAAGTIESAMHGIDALTEAMNRLATAVEKAALPKPPQVDPAGLIRCGHDNSVCMYRGSCAVDGECLRNPIYGKSE